jgi:hypothetical protein
LLLHHRDLTASAHELLGEVLGFHRAVLFQRCALAQSGRDVRELRLQGFVPVAARAGPRLNAPQRGFRNVKVRFRLYRGLFHGDVTLFKRLEPLGLSLGFVFVSEFFAPQLLRRVFFFRNLNFFVFQLRVVFNQGFGKSIHFLSQTIRLAALAVLLL